MVVTDKKYAVGVFSSRKVAQQAIDELKASGFSMEKVSIVAKDAETRRSHWRSAGDFRN